MSQPHEDHLSAKQVVPLDDPLGTDRTTYGDADRQDRMVTAQDAANRAEVLVARIRAWADKMEAEAPKPGAGGFLADQVRSILDKDITDEEIAALPANRPVAAKPARGAHTASGFCPDCPDHEACATGWHCDVVKRVEDETTQASQRAAKGVQRFADGDLVRFRPIDPETKTGGPLTDGVIVEDRGLLRVLVRDEATGEIHKAFAGNLMPRSKRVEP